MIKAVLFYLLFINVCFAQTSSLLWLAYDSSMLAPALELGKTRKVVVVVNPNDGPGASKDVSYSSFISAARKNPNISLRGYIDLATWHGDNPSTRALKDVKKEIELWSSLYGITANDGYWLDDCFPDKSETKKLVQSVSWAIPSKVFVNPGELIADSNWMRLSKFTVCDFEDPPTAKSFIKAKGPCVILFVNKGDWRKWSDLAMMEGAKYIGLEDFSRHHNGEFQKPMTWWKELK